MSWLWMALFLILSAVAVGLPFVVRPPSSPAAGEGEGEDLSYRQRRIEASLRDLDLDLGAGKITPEDHAAAVAELRAQLAPAPGVQGGPSA